MHLTDTHCHLDLEHFDADRHEVLNRAETHCIVHLLVPGLSLESSRSVLALVNSSSMLHAAIGVHPTEASTWGESTKEELRAMAGPDTHSSAMLKGDEGGRVEKIVAIGEIGLDYYWDRAPHELQRFVLREQLDLAASLCLPVIIHLREADDADHGPCMEHALAILDDWTAGLRSENNPLADAPGVLHSFSGGLDVAQKAISQRFFIGVSGPVTFKNARMKQELAAQLPLESLLIETDAPFLAPHPYRGKRNEPAFVAQIADKIAALQSRTLEEVARITTTNAARLFSWGETD